MNGINSLPSRSASNSRADQQDAVDVQQVSELEADKPDRPVFALRDAFGDRLAASLVELEGMDVMRCWR